MLCFDWLQPTCVCCLLHFDTGDLFIISCLVMCCEEEEEVSDERQILYRIWLGSKVFLYRACLIFSPNNVFATICTGCCQCCIVPPNFHRIRNLHWTKFHRNISLFLHHDEKCYLLQNIAPNYFSKDVAVKLGSKKTIVIFFVWFLSVSCANLQICLLFRI